MCRLARAEKRGLPDVWVMKDHSLYLTAPQKPATAIDVGVSELFGFNTGVFSMIGATEPSPEHIPFAFTRDTDVLVIVNADGKTMMTVADAVYKAFKDHGIPQIALENHTLTQKTILQDPVRTHADTQGTLV